MFLELKSIQILLDLLWQIWSLALLRPIPESLAEGRIRASLVAVVREVGSTTLKKIVNCQILLC